MIFLLPNNGQDLRLIPAPNGFVANDRQSCGCAVDVARSPFNVMLWAQGRSMAQEYVL